MSVGCENYKVGFVLKVQCENYNVGLEWNMKDDNHNVSNIGHEIYNVCWVFNVGMRIVI